MCAAEGGEVEAQAGADSCPRTHGHNLSVASASMRAAGRNGHVRSATNAATRAPLSKNTAGAH